MKKFTVMQISPGSVFTQKTAGLLLEDRCVLFKSHLLQWFDLTVRAFHESENKKQRAIAHLDYWKTRRMPQWIYADEEQFKAIHHKLESTYKALEKTKWLLIADIQSNGVRGVANKEMCEKGYADKLIAMWRSLEMEQGWGKEAILLLAKFLLQFQESGYFLYPFWNRKDLVLKGESDFIKFSENV